MTMDRQMEVLAETLAFAVPMAIARLAAMSKPVRDWTREQWAANAASLVGHQGDALMWPVRPRRSRPYAGAKDTAGTAEVFASLARGLAAAAWQPGGITWLGQHWCVDHARCERDAAEAAERIGAA